MWPKQVLSFQLTRRANFHKWICINTQHPMKHQMHGYLLSFVKTIQVRRTIYAEHCWTNKDDPISNVLQWTSSHKRARVVWRARTYLHQLSEDTECSLAELLRAMDDRNEWRKRVSGESMMSVWIDDDDEDDYNWKMINTSGFNLLVLLLSLRT